MSDGLLGLLENLYSTWNRKEFIHPDPLEFLHRHSEPADREIVGLVASGLAYGRVKQILKSVDTVLGLMGPSPSTCPSAQLMPGLMGFRHRFTTGGEIGSVLDGVRRVQKKHGSIGSFVAGQVSAGAGMLETQRTLIRELTGSGRASSLLPCPSRGSCCKRLNLWFRWMVRHDDVDPGGWEGVPPSLLMIPLDTHMWKVGRRLGFTARNSPDLKAALEITEGFRGICPEDPVRYDFALTRFGIRSELSLDSLLALLDR